MPACTHCNGHGYICLFETKTQRPCPRCNGSKAEPGFPKDHSFFMQTEAANKPARTTAETAAKHIKGFFTRPDH